MAWAKFPTRWILADGLKTLTWGAHRGDAVAALIVLMALSVHRNLRGKILENGLPANDETVVATYNDIQALTGLSRAKVAAALRLLLDLGVIERAASSSIYRLPGVGQDGGWGKLPQKHLLQGGVLTVLHGFTLRNQTELDGLKLYLLIVAMRSQKSGFAHIGYSKIVEHTGVQTNRLRRAKSLLIANELVLAENDPDSRADQGRQPLRYKVIGL